MAPATAGLAQPMFVSSTPAVVRCVAVSLSLGFPVATMAGRTRAVRGLPRSSVVRTHRMERVEGVNCEILAVRAV